ncbi:hypothetical protein [Dactylosporangium matsuzakiense]|uniref:Secreted protein n=1 Tax=Dactylosporangium matsuzakiense TaxID=53360 RepID=A0A9W6NK17_9ACTN|nr:hypothetical protein [Dactylosporangium matsuzakiense]GLK99261.1 hypothetical protein GCM10017581_010020 [Dactylosporangium matsuzakiense]
MSKEQPRAGRRRSERLARVLAAAALATAGLTALAPAKAYAGDAGDVPYCWEVAGPNGTVTIRCVRGAGVLEKDCYPCPWAEVDFMTLVTQPPEFTADLIGGLDAYFAGNTATGLNTLTDVSKRPGAHSLQVKAVSTGIPMPEPALGHLTAFGKDLSAALTVLSTDQKQGRALLDAAAAELTQGLPK